MRYTLVDNVNRTVLHLRRAPARPEMPLAFAYEEEVRECLRGFLLDPSNRETAQAWLDRAAGLEGRWDAPQRELIDVLVQEWHNGSLLLGGGTPFDKSRRASLPGEPGRPGLGGSPSSGPGMASAMLPAGGGGGLGGGPAAPSTEAGRPANASISPKAGEPRSGSSLGPASKAPPQTTACELTDILVSCRHRRFASQVGRKWVLEVVAADIGDTIEFSASGPGFCGRHPEWNIPAGIPGFAPARVRAAKTSVTVHPLTYGRPGWISDVMPRMVKVTASGCSGPPRAIGIHIYPTDKFGIRINPQIPHFKKWKEGIEKILAGMLSLFQEKPEIEILTGGVTVEAAWEEAEDDYRAFYKYSVAGGFDPLISAAFRVPFGPLAAIPAPLRRFLKGGFFAEVKGSFATQFRFERVAPDRSEANAELTGELWLAVGVELTLIDKEACSAEACGGTGLEGVLNADREAKKPTALLQFSWLGLLVRASVKLAWGWVELNHEFQLIDARKLNEEPFRIQLVPD